MNQFRLGKDARAKKSMGSQLETDKEQREEVLRRATKIMMAIFLHLNGKEGMNLFHIKVLPLFMTIMVFKL